MGYRACLDLGESISYLKIAPSFACFASVGHTGKQGCLKGGEEVRRSGAPSTTECSRRCGHLSDVCYGRVAAIEQFRKLASGCSCKGETAGIFLLCTYPTLTPYLGGSGFGTTRGRVLTAQQTQKPTNFQEIQFSRQLCLIRAFQVPAREFCWIKGPIWMSG